MSHPLRLLVASQSGMAACAHWLELMRLSWALRRPETPIVRLLIAALLDASPWHLRPSRLTSPQEPTELDANGRVPPKQAVSRHYTPDHRIVIARSPTAFATHVQARSAKRGSGEFGKRLNWSPLISDTYAPPGYRITVMDLGIPATRSQ